MLLIFLGLLIFLFITGFPVPYAIGLTSLAVLIYERGMLGIPYEIIAQRIIYGVNNFTLLAIPFFLLAGKLMNTGGITKRIFKFANTIIGYLPGGLGHANIVASIIFAGMSGSAVADAAGLGTIEVQAMSDEGYDKEFSAAVTAASSTIGPIIPPSIPLVMYGVMGDVSIAALLVAGIVPGLLMGLCMMIIVYYYAIKRGYPRRPFPKIKEVLQSFYEAFWPLLTPVILIGGILLGIFTATEAAAVASLYAFILSVFIYRELKIKDIMEIVYDTVKETALILFIVANASLYGWLLIKAQIPMMFIEQIFKISQNPLVILFILNLFLLIVGCFMETNAAITILTPIMMPLARAIGINPVHLGVVMVLNLMIGLLTPPIGMSLYAVARVARVSFDKMVRAVAPFYIPLLVSLILVTIFPQISLWLPNLLLGK
ncbi:MAG TPA: ABC transporter permease [Caldanaerobacter subterraneus]|uniref:ABC transporter permease n=2 Tax=Caldanaerobacter subterraneus TaxID=911092 RepID=A0A357VN99_9THEO|nr:ABC transporter permease [Caldanaerobacter subterraneus]